MDELQGTRTHAERQRPDAPVVQSQFMDLLKRVSVEFNALRGEVSALRRRVEQLEQQTGGRP
jgi:polyhydroxyalkanoate synthesis regulator phasin